MSRSESSGRGAQETKTEAESRSKPAEAEVLEEKRPAKVPILYLKADGMHVRGDVSAKPAEVAEKLVARGAARKLSAEEVERLKAAKAGGG